MGGKEWLQETLEKWSTVLAAHGPYTAAGRTGIPIGRTVLLRHAWYDIIVRHLKGLCLHAGAGQVLGLSVTCVSRDFKDFSGLVRALELSACRMQGSSS